MIPAVSSTHTATKGTQLGPYLILLTRVVSLPGLCSHIYDMREPWGLIHTEQNVGQAYVGSCP